MDLLGDVWRKGGNKDDPDQKSALEDEGRNAEALLLGWVHASMRWSVYILRCSDGSLYTGISNNVEERIKKHNAGKGAAYTRSHRPVALVWTMTVKSESAARKQEAKIKGLTRVEKLRLIGA